MSAASLVRFAITTRALLWIVGAVFTKIVPHYDTSSVANESSSFIDILGLRSFAHWDGVHFTGIANEGYRYEHSFAFFPLVPYTASALRNTALRPFIMLDMLDSESALLLSAFVLSNASFVAAAYLLYVLGLRILGDSKRGRRVALVASMLFCITPASIFMSAFYTESCFACLSFAGMIRARDGDYWSAALLFTFASCARSNGIVLSIFFIAVPSVATAARPLFNKLLVGDTRWSWYAHVLKPLCRHVAPVVLQVFISASPYLLHQAHAGWVFCDSIHDKPRPWCDVETYKQPMRRIAEVLNVPIGMYSWIQSAYWGNGFLTYWTLQQVPNFMLAAPIVHLSVSGILSTLSLRRNPFHIGAIEWTSCTGLTPFILHWSFLLLVSVFLMNVQVTTRFLSACPPLYWFAADVFLTNTNPASNRFSVVSARRGALSMWTRRGVVLYFVTYMVLGTLLFVTFYPWT